MLWMLHYRFWCYTIFCSSGARVAQWVRSLDLTTHTSLSPIRRGFAPGFVNNKKGPLDSQPQVIKFNSCLPMFGGSLLVFRGRWFSPGIPASSITKTGCHDTAEILLKVALKHQKSTTKICSSDLLDFRIAPTCPQGPSNDYPYKSIT